VRRQGWGFKLKINGDVSDLKAVRDEFADARRSSCSSGFVTFPPTASSKSAGSAASRPRRPIAEAESSLEQAVSKPLRVTAAPWVCCDSTAAEQLGANAD
jgi:hypothetical protein